MTWTEILSHPFVKGHVLILEDSTNMPLTRPLSVNSLQVKEQQRKDHVSNKALNQPQNKVLVKSDERPAIHNTDHQKRTQSRISKTSQNNDDLINLDLEDNKNNNLCTDKMQNLSLDDKKGRDLKKSNTNLDDKRTSSISPNKCEKLNFIEESQPLENDEWIVFLQKNMEEILSGELTSLTQPNLANIIVSPLRNTHANTKVISYVTRLLSLPFVIGTTDSILDKIKTVYLEVKLIPNLVYSSKLLLRSSTESSSSPLRVQGDFKDLTGDDFQCMEFIFMLITRLIYWDNEFLSQFCDAAVVLNIYNILEFFLVTNKSKLKLTLDVLAILTHILRMFPENLEIIDRAILNESGGKVINLVELLRHSESLLRERTCFFLLLLGKHQSTNKMALIWNEAVQDTLEALMYDSIESVRNAADRTVDELKLKEFYMN